MQDTIISKSAGETIRIGKKYAESINPGEIIGLYGELGSGKTRFVMGICKFFKVNDIINSPTFIIVNEYTGTIHGTNQKIKINHFDFYRIKDISELDTIGFNDYFDNSLNLIEWPEIIEKFMNVNIKKIFFSFGKHKNERIIQFNSKK